MQSQQIVLLLRLAGGSMDKRADNSPVKSRSGNQPALQLPGPADPVTPDSQRQAQAATPDFPGPLLVSKLTLADLPRLGQIRRVVPLYEPGSGVSFPPSDFWRSMTASALGRLNHVVLVARSGDRLVGLARYRTDAPDQRWQIDLLASETGIYDPNPVWRALIVEGIRQAGMSGVKRLYAVAERDSGVWRALVAEQYAGFASETVLVCKNPAPSGRSRSVRLQQTSDTWAVHQLYIAAVPKDVQQAEALTSHEWDMDQRRLSGGRMRTGWLIESGHQVIGCCRMTERSSGNLIELLVMPDDYDAGEALLDHALAVLPRSGSSHQTWCAIRGYQQELIPMFLERGFTPILEQDHLVRYTTVQQRVVAQERIHLLHGIGRKVPRRATSVPNEA